VQGRVKLQEHTVRIYCVGHGELVETLTRLPELLLHPSCETIKSEKKTRVARLPLRIGRAITPVYIKQHNAVSLGHRLGALFGGSAALRSLYGAATLLREGYATARPIGAVEYHRAGLLIKSFYLAEELSGAKTVVSYWRDQVLSLGASARYVKRRAVLSALASLVKSLHEKRIYHNDLQGSNILACEGSTGETSFSLIDLQGVRKCLYLSARRRIKNLAQLNRTLGACLTRTEKLFFVKMYVDGGIDGHQDKRRFIRSIVAETSRQVLKETSRQRRRTDLSRERITAPRAVRRL
jgi:hypothetical protein